MMYISQVLIYLVATAFFMMAYAFNKYHVMNSLIIAEYVVTLILIMAFSMNKLMQMEVYMMFLIVIALVSESVIGVSIVVSLIRTHSNDFLKSVNSMKF